MTTERRTVFVQPVPVRQGRRKDMAKVITTLVESFCGGDFATWLIPDPDERRTRYKDYFELLVKHAFDVGWVDVTSDCAGVALWQNFEETYKPPPIPDYEARLAAAVGPALPRFQAMDLIMEKRHPVSPHHYLTHLAVHPNAQRRGLGSALLACHHNYLDRHERWAYLEATGEANQSLYKRHGYRPLPPYEVPGGGPTVRPMTRKPVPENG